jgi:ribonuclease R
MDLEPEHVLKALRHAPREGLRADEIAKAVNADAKGKHRLRKLLSDLCEQGAVEKAPGSRYRLAGLVEETPKHEHVKPGRVVGRLRVHPAGYGFVQRDDGEDDVFVPARYRSHALDGDRVALTTWMGYKGTEGRVDAVLERGRAKLTGTLRGAGRLAHLEPDDPRIAATGGHVQLEGGAGGARDGQAVVAEITRYPTEADEPLIARVTHILGDPDDPRTEIAKILICGDIPTEFPDEVLAAAERAPTAVGEHDRADRVDLRDRAFLTIDPETARDFDDAVCVEPSPKPGFTRLWVAVADVSAYVPAGGALDREARVRGCSVYLPDRAIPMLPKQLSSGICSLNPEVDRLAMVARLEIDEQGGVSDEYFCAAVIKSRARLDYAGVAAALKGDLRGPRARYKEFLPQLVEMQGLAKRLRALRARRGALDFELPEAKVMLDEDDPTRVRDVVQSRADADVKGAYQLVEDFMLAANEAVARAFRERKLDTMWRVHDVPADERLEQFSEIAASYGLRFTVEDGKDPKKVREFLEKLHGRPASVERALNFLLLRTLKQAVYDVVNVGHFGLGARDYVHFTSPIRRYPDLIVHRLLKHVLHSDGLPAGGPPAPPPERAQLQAMANESSSHERRAMEAEREVVDLYRAHLMREHVGEEYDGTIAGVAAFGLFVQIEAPFVDGLVRTESIGDDFYELDEQTMRLVGKRTGRAFALGDQVRVRIENVSVPRRKIDLVLVEHRATAVSERSGGGRESRPRAHPHNQDGARDRKRRGREPKATRGGGGRDSKRRRR